MGQKVKSQSPKIVCDNIPVVWSFVRVALIRFEYPRIRSQYKLGGPNANIHTSRSTGTWDGH
eukprot:16451304-Heterocapsa_arctica.AAC.1